jgi:hypothetical protein
MVGGLQRLLTLSVSLLSVNSWDKEGEQQNEPDRCLNPNSSFHVQANPELIPRDIPGSKELGFRAGLFPSESDTLLSLGI